MSTNSPLDVRPVEDDQWQVVAWLWQAYRNDLAPVVNGLPYADGRYQARELNTFPHEGAIGYLVWRPHPNTGEDAPIAFALVDGLADDRRSVRAFWVASPARRDRVGHRLALEVINRHPGDWTITFQHDNKAAMVFWRRVADDAFGPGRWTEQERRVPHRPNVPPDHWIETCPVPGRAARRSSRGA